MHETLPTDFPNLVGKRKKMRAVWELLAASLKLSVSLTLFLNTFFKK